LDRKQLQQWLDLSINKLVPISLLIMSRAFTLETRSLPPEEVNTVSESKQNTNLTRIHAQILRDSISTLDHDVINEVGDWICDVL
jgi:hypothetical protein